MKNFEMFFESVDSDEIRIKNSLDFIYGLLPAKQIEYIEFFKSLNLTDEQLDKLSTIIREYGDDQFEGGRSAGGYGPEY